MYISIMLMFEVFIFHFDSMFIQDYFILKIDKISL
jgi:hypothetical protein